MPTKQRDDARHAAHEKPVRLDASIIVEYEDRDGKPQKRWVEVGSAFPHRDGDGMNVVIHPGLSVSGTIVLTVPKPRQPQD